MATKAQHTPGPWQANTKRGGVTYIQNGDGRILATVSGLEDGRNNAACKATQEANAALVASAPDLLAQRDELLAALRDCASELNRLSLGSVIDTGERVERIRAVEDAARAAIAKAEGGQHGRA